MTSLKVLALPLALSLILGAGCSSVSSIVKKPEIREIRRVAVVGFTAPQRVPHRSGRGQVMGWSEANRLAIADQALATYAGELKRLGWEVVPSATLAALPIYQENFAPRISKANNGIGKALNNLGSLSVDPYFTPTGLHPVVWEDDSRKDGTMRLDLGTLSLEKTKNLKTKMQEVAVQAGVDAVLLVQADYCYDDGSVWVGHAGSGTGSAVITGASAIYAVTPKGVEVVRMKRIQSSCGGDNRVASDSATPMVKGQLLYGGEKIQKMFLEVARKNAAENIKAIQNAMN